MLEGLNSDILERPASIAASDTDGDVLAHFGIKGQKWGVRRYQNSDGSLTEEGKLRYGDSRQSLSKRNLTKGQARFAKDAIVSLDQTPLSKNEKAFNETLKQLGKAAEESGAMDPNRSLSPYDLSRSPEQSELFNAIYENMPSVKKNTETLYKQEASKYKKNADDFRKEKTTHLDDVINDRYPDLHKELGTKPGKDTRKFLMDAVKGYNEGDPDMVTYQHMDLAPILFDEGYLDKQTFNKLYDGQAAEDAVDNLHYGWNSDDIKKYNGWYKELHHSDDTSDFLAHHGIKGQKWGNRRYQNSDGSLTPLGRVRYGVGAARKTAGKALRKATGRQTDAELQDELNKAIKKYNRDMMKRDIDNLSGKRKKISKMTDSELDAYIDRMAKEQKAQAMSKELKNEGRNFISKFAHEAAENTARQAVAGIGEGVKRGISNSLATKFDEAEKRKQATKWDKYDEKHNADKVDAAKTRDKLNAARDKLELRALNGDIEAAATLNRVAKASKGNSDKHNFTSATKDALENARNMLELQAINGDEEALKRLKKVTNAKKGGKKQSGNQGSGNQGSGNQGSGNQGSGNQGSGGKKKSNGQNNKQDTSKPASSTSNKNSKKSTDNPEPKKSIISSQEAYQAAKQKAKENLKKQASVPVSEASAYSASDSTTDWIAEQASKKTLPPDKK